MRERILVVDDEKEIVSLISDTLLDENYNVITAYSAEEALTKIKNNPDLILLDIMMPGKDGFEFCKEVRECVSCPIIFTTAKADEDDIIKGLALGGDDYITKPFSIKQLKARILAHLRRDRRNLNVEKKYLVFDDFKIDLIGREVFYKEEVISLTKREFDIIELLALNSGQVFTKDGIYEKIWGYDAEGDSATVAEHIKKIRSKFSSTSVDEKYINTVWGVGYKWDECKRG